MIKSITSVKVANRRVFVRVGFDVPLKRNIHTEQWEVADDARIRDALPTLKHLIESGAKIIIGSHLNRPKGWDKDKSLLPAALKLGEMLSYKVVEVEDSLPSYPIPHIFFLSSDITTRDYSGLTRAMRNGNILFLENLRFYPGEQENNPEFIKILASFADIFANEAFSDAHRKDASVFGLAQNLPAYAGIDFLAEIQSLNKIIRNPKKPMVLLMGGAKISDKVPAIENLALRADYILVGGEIANTFLKAVGYEVGKSRVGDIEVAKQLLRNFKEKIVMPVDVVVAKSPDDLPKSASIDKVLPIEIILDIGPETIRKFSKFIKSAATLVWNGPFGLIENPKFAYGSRSVAYIFASRSRGKAFGLVGGGETVEVIDAVDVRQFIDHVSVGGGAMLDFLAGKKLPAIKALEVTHA